MQNTRKRYIPRENKHKQKTAYYIRMIYQYAQAQQRQELAQSIAK